MKRESLRVEKRKILGKKVKKLRREGILPANIYGRDFASTAVQVSMADFKKVFEKAHKTHLVDLLLDGKTLPVLIHNVAQDPRTGEFIHADFYKVDLKEKIEASIPIVPVGEARAVAEKKGVLLTPLSELRIEALPSELPEKVEVDVSGLGEMDDQITVRDIKLPANITVITNPDQIVFKIGELVSREVEEQVAAEEAEKAEAAEKIEDTEKAVEAGEQEKQEKQEVKEEVSAE
jgi:large subunit ribosomal protein L25